MPWWLTLKSQQYNQCTSGSKPLKLKLMSSAKQHTGQSQVENVKAMMCPKVHSLAPTVQAECCCASGFKNFFWFWICVFYYHILSYISMDYGYFISYENADFPYIFYIYISDYANFPMKLWQILRKDPASAFVFGGDLFDRGSGDLRLAEELIQLKRTDRKTWGHSRFFRCKWLIHW